MAPWVLHVDMDQFIAAVEVLHRPELAGLPVIVGGRGDPTERAVVSTASYEAREYGVHSGMPLRLAARKCPEAVLLPVDGPAYDAASAVVMETLRAIPERSWRCSAGTRPSSASRPTTPSRWLVTRRRPCSRRPGCTARSGIGDTKVRAKTATDFGKPRGTFRLTCDNWFEVMGDRPTRALWGVGSRIQQRLAGLGITTVRELAASPEEPLVAEFGPHTGPHYGRLGRGVSSARVDDTPWVARAHGRETTYQQDLRTPEEVASALEALAVQVVADIEAEGRACERVHLKVRFTPFFTVTRQRKLPVPTSEAAVIAATALELYRGLEDDRPVRLLGVRAEMVPPEGGYDPPRTHGRRGSP